MAIQGWPALPLALIALLVQPLTQDSVSTRIERQVAKYYADAKPGALSVQVLVGDMTLFEGGHGSARVGSKTSVSSNTSLAAGPMAQVWLATALLQLASADKVHLDDRVAQLLPGLLPADSAVRVGELLRHTSGLADYRDHASKELLLKGATYAELMGSLKDIAPVNSPGACVAECATDTLLCAALLEKLTGEAADEVLQRALFMPLKMESSGYKLESAPREASFDLGSAPAFSPSGLYSSAADLARFSRGLIERTALDSEGVEEILRKVRLTDGSTTSFGMGLRHVELGETEGHVLGGQTASISHYPAHDLVIAVIGRGNGAELESLGRSLARLVVEEPSAERLDLPLTPDQQAVFLGHYQIGCTAVVIRSEGARLVLDEIDRPPAVLLYQGENLFIARDEAELTVHFEVLAERAASFELVRDGLRSVAVRFTRYR